MSIIDNFLRFPWRIGLKIGSCIPSPIKYKKPIMPTKDELIKAVLNAKILDFIRKNNPDDLLNLPYLDFMLCVELLRIPGELIESYFCKYYEKVNPSIEKGDRMDSESGKSFQFKASLIWCGKREAMIRRIQIWQDVDEYRIIIIDEQNHYRPYIYSLTKEEMKIELEILNAIPHNSTKKANELNKNTPKSFSLNCSDNNPNFIRWQNKYRRNDLEKKYVDIINSEENINISEKDFSLHSDLCGV